MVGVRRGVSNHGGSRALEEFGRRMEQGKLVYSCLGNLDQERQGQNWSCFGVQDSKRASWHPYHSSSVDIQ